ncbi:Peptidyl-prolyl cis-trans isomerase A [Durusdinium trenchii]|uniref:Peptidyl-prolyl cis-trans isomerase A n=1 Tax=Durusdinium trenchii TaxID=1381693 RepID=A0ABP0Q078_9DINO
MGAHLIRIARSKSDLNEKWSPSIRDDVRSARDTLKFPKGTLSFVAKGPDARTTQVMISLSDLTGRLGHNPWETPIGHVLEEDFPVLDQFFTGYQDAIEEEELLKRGNGYLQEFFPRVDYIQSCSLLDDPLSAALSAGS